MHEVCWKVWKRFSPERFSRCHFPLPAFECPCVGLQCSALLQRSCNYLRSTKNPSSFPTVLSSRSKCRSYSTLQEFSWYHSEMSVSRPYLRGRGIDRDVRSLLCKSRGRWGNYQKLDLHWVDWDDACVGLVISETGRCIEPNAWSERGTRANPCSTIGWILYHK